MSYLKVRLDLGRFGLIAFRPCPGGTLPPRTERLRVVAVGLCAVAIAVDLWLR